MTAVTESFVGLTQWLYPALTATVGEHCVSYRPHRYSVSTAFVNLCTYLLENKQGSLHMVPKIILAPAWTDIFTPLCDMPVFSPPRPFLPLFQPLLHLFYTFNFYFLFLSSFFLSLPHFPPFSAFSFHTFHPVIDISYHPGGGGGGGFQKKTPLKKNNGLLFIAEY